MPSRFRISVMGVLILASLVFGVDEYVADRAHTNISFTVTHMAVTRVTGKFKDFSVVFKFDPQSLEKSSIMVTIQAKSIDTDNEKRDNHLRSEDFLFAEKFPEITFHSTGIKRSEDGYIAHGKLTIRGVTREISLPFTVAGPVADPYGNLRIGISAETTINRMDFGVSWNKLLDTGGLVVGEEVLIRVDAEFLRKKEIRGSD